MDEYQHLRESADEAARLRQCDDQSCADRPYGTHYHAADTFPQEPVEFTVTRDGVVEMADNGYTAEASELGLAPGVWPDRIVMDEWRFNRVRTTRAGEEVRSVIYIKQWYGPVTELEIFND